MGDAPRVSLSLKALLVSKIFGLVDRKSTDIELDARAEMTVGDFLSFGFASSTTGRLRLALRCNR